MNNLEAIFVDVDDFCQQFLPAWQNHLINCGEKQRIKPSRLSISEVMTLAILFHQSRYRNFKSYYCLFVCPYLKSEFPQLVSYNQIIVLIQAALLPLCAYLIHKKAKPTGIAFIDSTQLQVCHNLRIPRHCVFKDVAQRGKGSTGWFYGFKLHLMINDAREIMALKVTAGNVDDRAPVPDMCKGLWGTLYADKGYISGKLEQQLAQTGVELVTNTRKDMKTRLLNQWDKLMLRKRFIIETVFDQLKNMTQITHSRHRCYTGFMVNLISGLIAYTFQTKKPTIKVSQLHI